MTFHLFGGKRDQRIVLTVSTALMAAIDAYRERKSKAAVVRLAVAGLIRNPSELQLEYSIHLADTRRDLCRFELVMAMAQSAALHHCARTSNLAMCEVAELACWRYLAA